MEPERNEVYERIPWETLDRPRADRQWLMLAVAGAVAVGALAFSFMRGQPVAAPPLDTTAPVAPATAPPVAETTMIPAAAAPMVMAEEDLFAVDIDHLAELAASHAEWFAVEYLSVDGSDQSRQALAGLMPAGVPLPEAPEGKQVFVDWAGARSVEEAGPLTFLVEVVVRSLVASGDGIFTRQPATLLEIEVAVGEDGIARVLMPPKVLGLPQPAPAQVAFAPVPEEIKSLVEASHGPVVGGRALAEGSWLVVAMVTGPDGVTRPVTVAAP